MTINTVVIEAARAAVRPLYLRRTEGRRGTLRSCVTGDPGAIRGTRSMCELAAVPSV